MQKKVISNEIFTITDYGAKAAKQLLDKNYRLPQFFSPSEAGIIALLFREKFIPAARIKNFTIFSQLEDKKIIQEENIKIINLAELQDKLTKRFYRSPVIHNQMLMLEYTTLCNLSCRSCFKAYLPRVTEEQLDDLAKTIDDAKQMGVGSYVFNGGEVTKYAQGWLDLSKYIAATGHEVIVITNGWWGQEGSIKTIDGIYQNTADYVQKLAQAGVKKIIFSVDGLREEHDAFRRSPGLYNKIVNAVEIVRRAGIYPMVSIVLNDYIKDRKKFFDEITKIFQLTHNLNDLIHKKEELLKTGVLLEEMIDEGNAIKMMGDKKNAPYSLDDESKLHNYCKGFTKGIKLSIRATGDVEPCTGATFDKGFGNIHQENLRDIVNKMKDTVVYKMFRENDFGKYIPYIDRSLFGTRFFNRCSILTILSCLAPRLERLKEKDALTKKNIYQANLQIARQVGYSR